MAKKKKNQIAYKRIARKRRRLKILKSTITTLAIVGILVLAVYLCQAKTITVTGNINYSAEMIKADIIDNKIEENTLYQRILDLLNKHPKVPYLTTYEIVYTSINSMTIEVYEKEPVAYFANDAGYVLFDKDGIVLRVEQEAPADIPLIEGLEVESVALFDTLPAKDGNVFNMLKNLVTQIRKNDLKPSRILLNDENEMEMTFANITVKLGTDASLENKIARLIAMLPSLEGKSGVLYMEDVDENTDKISFIKTK